MHRVDFWIPLFVAAVIGTPLPANDQIGDAVDPQQATAGDDGAIQWYDIRLLGVEGRAFDDTQEFYDRLPGRAEGVVRAPVWSLSRNSTGMCVRFVTDAAAIHARWTLRSERLEMPHMPATGVSGLDLYVKHEGQWKWLATGRPTAKTNTAQLASGIPAGERMYWLYLPLYNGVESVEIGLPSGASLKKLERAAEHNKPIVFWGTSITQGGCASRTGMVHTAILGRRLDRPVINLGFSGNGKMEQEVADLAAEIDAALFVIDCLPNMNASEVAERTQPLVRTLRKAHPATPIVLAEDRTYGTAFLLESSRERNATSRAALRKAYDELVADGVENLHYLDGDSQLGDDNLGTVDGSHPTDLGFLRMADAFEKVLRPVLEKSP